MEKIPLIIIGGGVSGCFAAISSNNLLPTLIIEQNDEVLKKFMMTGKGHSNIANTLPPPEFLKNLIDSNKFLYPAINRYDGKHLLALLDSLKISYYEKAPHKFHLSDTNASMRRKILKLMEEKQVQIALQTKVLKITPSAEGFVIDTNHTTYLCEHLIIATGGLSYPSLGCHGDGYKFAQALNLPVKAPYPIGVGLHCDVFDKSLQGTTIDNVKVKVIIDKIPIYEEEGPLMFTHYGIGGPVIRRVSGYLSKALMLHQKCQVELSFVSPAQFQAEIKGKHYLKECFSFLPPKFITTHLASWEKTDLKNLKKCDALLLQQRLCSYQIAIESTEDITFAINTGGGINLKAINPNTYESTIKNLYFIGEVLDLNPRTNGFNITTCYASANQCMEGIAKKTSLK